MKRVLLVLALVPLLLSLGAAEATWTGRVSVVGSVPFQTLALTEASGRQWKLRGETTRLAAQAQGRWVTVQGRAEGTTLVVTSWTLLPEDAHG